MYRLALLVAVVVAGLLASCSGAEEAAVSAPAMPRHVLSTGKIGQGRVQSQPAGVDCGSSCSAPFGAGTRVTLAVTPDAGWRFDGFGGACSGQDCTLTLDADAAVTAHFSEEPAAPEPVQHLLSAGKIGEGSLRSVPDGLDCGATCVTRFEAGTLVTLIATPDSGWRFEGYSGDCAGRECALTMDGDRLVTARFVEDLGGGPLAKACDAYTGPAPAELHHYEGLMHEHSAYSDGDPHSIPADYFRIAAERGFDFVGASEHSDSYDEGNYVTLHASCSETPDGLLTCAANPSDDKLHKWLATQAQAEAATTGKFLAIRGFEWTSDMFGHINVYFSRNFTNAKTDGGYAVSMDTFWDWFTRAADTPGDGGSPTSTVPNGGGADGLAHFNHPHDKCQTKNDPTGATVDACDWNDYTLVPAAVERVFGMEVYNDGNRDDKYMPWYVRALDKGWRVAPIASEDEHFAQYAVEFRPKTVTIATAPTVDAFKTAWLARRTYALTPGRHLRAELDAEGHPMGSQLSCDTGKVVAIAVALREQDGTPFEGTLRLYGASGEKVAELPAGEGVFQVPARFGRQWYFVRAHGPDGKSVAYLAPVWITGR